MVFLNHMYKYIHWHPDSIEIFIIEYICTYVQWIYLITATHQPSVSLTADLPAVLPVRALARRQSSWQETLDESTKLLPRTADVFAKIDSDSRLSYNLASKGALPGAVLKHCFEVVDQVVSKNSPLIYKVGYTHCPWTRFFNNKFGYHLDRDKWTNMKVLYVSGEPISPGFVEAALIQRHKGHFPANMLYSFSFTPKLNFENYWVVKVLQSFKGCPNQTFCFDSIFFLEISASKNVWWFAIDAWSHDIDIKKINTYLYTYIDCQIFLNDHSSL